MKLRDHMIISTDDIVIPCSWSRRNSVVKMSILPPTFCRFSAVCNQTRGTHLPKGSPGRQSNWPYITLDCFFQDKVVKII